MDLNNLNETKIITPEGAGDILVVPKPRSRRILFLKTGAFILAISILGGGYYFFQYIPKTKPPQKISLQTLTTSISQVKRALETKERMNFGNISNTQDISTADWPKDFSKLILANPLELKEQRGGFPTGEKGYIASYYIDQQSLVTIHRSFINSFYPVNPTSGFQINSQRANSYAFIEAENSAYEIKITEEVTSGSKIFLNIKIKLK